MRSWRSNSVRRCTPIAIKNGRKRCGASAKSCRAGQTTPRRGKCSAAASSIANNRLRQVGTACITWKVSETADFFSASRLATGHVEDKLARELVGDLESVDAHFHLTLV